MKSISRMAHARRSFVVSVLMIVLAHASVGAALAAEPDPPGSHRDWGLGWKIRGGGASGGYGKFLEKGIAWDLDIFKQKKQWRYGLGLMFETLAMKDPYQDEPEWAHFETYWYAQRMFNEDEALRPYLQGRIGVARSHPRSELFLKQPYEELDPGESPTDAENGVGVSLIPGVEYYFGPGIALDVSTYLNLWLTEKYDMSPIGIPDEGTGVEWGARVGATWRPTSYTHPAHTAAPPDTSPLPPGDKHKDAWGVTRSPGWAAAEVLGINFGASMFNEYVRQANFNQISPRSFWYNIEQGFNYDDNHFKTNQMIHPFNGSTYFNSGRANGLDFWGSTVTSMSGAFVWEAMGETHTMSFNDMISTGIGGIAFGEAMYRLATSILDNRSTGKGRNWREVGALLVNPVNGFNRFVSGRATRVQGNPSNPYDWRPPFHGMTMAVGARITGTGESIHDSTKTQAVIDLHVDHGSAWDNERRKPFDHFDVDVQANGSDKTPIGRLQIRGDLFSKALGGTGKDHALALVQYFDYVNNDRFEFGGQSFGGALFSRFRPSENIGIRTRVDAMGMILGAVNSEYAYIVQTPGQERLREYDYGPGLGFSAEAFGYHKARRILSLYYRAQWIKVSNGSVYNTEENSGSDADHYLQSATAKLNIPVRDAMSLGFDASVYLRESHFAKDELRDLKLQRVPQARFYLSWSTE